MLLQLNPTIPMISPKGKCVAHVMIDEGAENDIMWVCFQDDNGECWTWSNKDIRIQQNITLGRTYEKK